MDYRNKITFEIRRGRNVPLAEIEAGLWFPNNWINKNGKLETLSVPSCPVKYFKYVNGKVLEMTTAQKKVVDDAQEKLLFQNRSSDQILRDIRDSFEDEAFILDLANCQPLFLRYIDKRDWEQAKKIVQLIPADKCSSNDKDIILGCIPNG